MIDEKRRNRLTDTLNKLDKKDIYSLMLFSLYKMKDDKEFSTLSELCYALEGKNLINFLKYFGGTTIKVPTLKDMRLLVQALLMYQHINIEGELDFDKVFSLVDTSEFSKAELKKVYEKILSILKEYDFSKV